MKLVALMYLAEDEGAVDQLLKQHGVVAYSELPIEGHGEGMKGWYGEVAPFQSRMTFAVLPAAKAVELMDAVAACEGCKDPTHPIHALLVNVERTEESGSAKPR